MLISEYIWLRWLATQKDPHLIDKMQDAKLPKEEKLPEKHKDKYHPMYRKRKQVSSHIQVLKDFYKRHPYCEWLLLFLRLSISALCHLLPSSSPGWWNEGAGDGNGVNLTHLPPFVNALVQGPAPFLTQDRDHTKSKRVEENFIGMLTTNPPL